MKTPTNQDVQRLLEAAAQLIVDYRSQFRTTRFKKDEQNIDRLADAIEPFVKPDETQMPIALEVRS